MHFNDYEPDLSQIAEENLTSKVHDDNWPDGDPIEPEFEGDTGVIIATGPSLTDEQLTMVRDANVRVFTLNNVYQRVNWQDVHLSCDFPWWRWYYPRDDQLVNLSCTKLCWHPDLAKIFGLRYIKGEVKPGLSRDPSRIRINHGSSPMLINVAALYGIKKLILIGHDMKFAPDYQPKIRYAGSTPRHYFGEYPEPLQHWPSVKVGLSEPGVIDGLIETYDAMKEDLAWFGMDVINCTPDSALTSFPFGNLLEEL